MKRIMVLVLFIVLLSSQVWSATYYVTKSGSDSNAGSSGSPWLTIGKAVSTMTAGDTVIIAAGTYSENITTQRSGSSGLPITFRASGTVYTGSWSIVHDYTIVDGFTLSTYALAWIFIGNSTNAGSEGSYSQILNCHIVNGEMGFRYRSSAHHCLIKGNHLTVPNGVGNDHPQIYVFGSYNVVEENELGPSQDIDGFRLWGHHNILRRNHIHDVTLSPGSTAHSDGIQIYGDNGDASYENLIDGNRFFGGMQLFNLTQDWVADIRDITFTNNVFANYEENANLGIPNTYFYNNVFYRIPSFNCPTTVSGYANCTNQVFKNNVFIGVTGYNESDYTANHFIKKDGTFTFAYNFWSTLAGAALSNYDNQTGGINGGAINFTNASNNDFTLLSNSPAINAGTTITSFNYDLLGNNRPYGAAWDMGAYEFGAGGVDETAPIVSTPRTIASNGTTLTIPFSETVTSATSGTGGFTISASGGSATLAYASGSGTSSLVYTISRTIASGETVTLSYAIPGSGARVEDVSTNTNDLLAFNGTSVTNNSAQAPPTLSTKTVALNGTTLTLVFNEIVTTTALSGAGGWTIAPSSGAATLAYASGSGTTSLVYTISRRIMTGETTTVSYSGTYVKDATSLNLATITNSSVTNDSDSVAAFIDNLSPSGIQACTSNPRNVTLSHTTSEVATSRMSLTDVAYSSMSDTFTTTGGTSHSEVKSLACGASYTYYIRTSDAQGNVNTSSSTISFSIASPQIAGPGGLRIIGGRLTH